MNTLLRDERFIRKAFLSDDIRLKQVCERFLEHFEEEDTIKHTCHCRTIWLLYIDKTVKRTKENVATEVYTNPPALKEERTMYVEYFLLYCQKVFNGDITIEAAITEVSHERK